MFQTIDCVGNGVLPLQWRKTAARPCKKVRIDNPNSTDLSELDFNFSGPNALNKVKAYKVIEDPVLNVAEISKNLHDDVVAKAEMIERLINEADEYALHIKESGRMIVKLRKANEEITKTSMI